MLKEIYYNEEIWLKSIGCNINKTEQIMIVNRKEVTTEDFNYLLPLSNTNITYEHVQHVKGIKIRESTNIKHNILDNIKQTGISLKKSSSDVQMISNSKLKTLLDEIIINDCIYLDRASKGEWCGKNDKDRFFSNKIVPYFIYYLDSICGRICLVNTKNTIGIYDFEIFPQFRNNGIAYKVLSFLITECSHDNPTLFIQTWEDNKVAYDLYLKAGFEVIDRYFVYTVV